MLKRTRNNWFRVKTLHQKVIDALGDEIVTFSCLPMKPLEIEVKNVTPYKFRFYVFNCGNPPGGRAINEFKIVLNVGQLPSLLGNFDYSNGHFPIVIGYVNSMDVFILWDSTKHKDFAFNKNMQVKSETIYNALAMPTSKQKRITNNGLEVVIAARSAYLAHALKERMNITYSEVTGKTL